MKLYLDQSKVSKLYFEIKRCCIFVVLFIVLTGIGKLWLEILSEVVV